MADARQVCAVMDGAEWIDGVVDLQCPEALRILDFPHAAQAVSAIGQEAGMSQSQASAPWLTTQLHTLKHEGPAPVLAGLARLCALFPLNEQMNKAYAYLARRQAHAVPPVSARRLADRLRHRGKWQQSRDASSPQRGWDALGTLPCQSHAGLTHRCLQ